MSEDTLKIIEHPRVRRSVARNILAHEARGDILVFLDDNSIVKNNFYQELKKFTQLILQERVALQGSIYYGTQTPNLAFKSLFLEYKNATKGTFNVAHNGTIDTAFFIISKNAFEELGGFKEWTNRYEDREFALRFKKQHNILPFSESYVVKIIETMNYWGLLKKRMEENYYKLKCNLIYKGLVETLALEWKVITRNYLAVNRLKYINTLEGSLLFLMNLSINVIWISFFPFTLIFCQLLLLLTNPHGTGKK